MLPSHVSQVWGADRYYCSVNRATLAGHSGARGEGISAGEERRYLCACHILLLVMIGNWHTEPLGNRRLVLEAGRPLTKFQCACTC